MTESNDAIAAIDPTSPDLERSIAEHFESQVRKAPGRIALQTPEADYSYGELNELANAAAHRLQRELANMPGAVGLWLDRSLDQTACLMAVWKTGRTFFNNDPNVPAAYSREILAIVEPAAIITSRHFHHQVLACAPEGTRILICEDLMSGPRPDNLGLKIPAETVLRLIFTSGSTGTPKAVEHDQRSMLYNRFNYALVADLHQGDVQLQVSPLSHLNGSFWIVGCLVAGATLSCYPLKEWGLEGLADWISEKRVTRFAAVPTVFRHFIKAGRPSPEKLASVRVVHLGGETIRRDDVLSIREFFPATAKMVCNIGSTEGGCIAHLIIDRETPVPEGPIPLGAAYPGVKILLWDDQENDVPPGQTGEIVVQSPSLARGYFKQPELTAKSFLHDKEDPRIRRFKTGDMGRLDTEGRLVFAGRKDQQVKINGHRVELGDIESALQCHPKIKAAAVRTWPDPLKDILLAAYYVTIGGQTLDSVEVESWLSDRLPAYMRPRHVARLDQIPLTLSNKIDRDSLPPPPAPTTAATGDPLSPMQRSLLDLWCRLFDNDALGIDDDFFALGGDSLHAVQLLAEVARLTGLPSPPDLVFRAPTVRKMVEAVEAVEAGFVNPENIVPLQPHGTKPPLFMVHGWGGGIFHFADLARRIGTDRPIFGIQGNEHCGTEPKPKSVGELAGLYSDHIEARHPTGPCHLLGYSAGGMLAFAIGSELRKRGKQVELVIIIDTLPLTLPNRHHRKIVRPHLSHRLRAHFSDLLSGRQKPDLPFLQGRWKALRHHLKPLQERQTILPDQAADQPEPLETDYYALLARTDIPHPCDLPIALMIAEDTKADLLAAWQYLSNGNARSHVVPGSHLEVMNSDNISNLAETIAKAIQAAPPVHDTGREARL